ncbi:MAG: thermonuclease family protein, partial [Planctomycetota bacterium]
MSPEPAKLTDRQRRSRQRVRRVYGIALLIVIVVILVCSDHVGLFGRAPKDDLGRYDGQTFWCVKVIDGDTLDVNIPDPTNDHKTTRIRLWGVNTPELGKDGRPPEYFALEAAYLAHELADGKQLTLHLVPGHTRGGYERLLAYVILPDGRMLNRVLIETGAGYADPRYEHDLMAEFLALQDAAMAQRIGLWA